MVIIISPSTVRLLKLRRCIPNVQSGMETFVGCQRGSVASATEEECQVVAYESCGRAGSSAAANPIKPEPSDEGCEMGLDPHTEDRTSPEEGDGMDGGAASRERGASSTSGESGGKRAKCEHGRDKYRCKECGGSGFCPHGRQKRQCKECGGSAICPHWRIKSTCKDCQTSVRNTRTVDARIANGITGEARIKDAVAKADKA